MPEIQESLPLEPKAPNRFVIPDDPVVTPSGNAVAVTPAEPIQADTEDSAPSTEPEVKPEPEVTPEQLAAKRERRAQNKLEKAYRVRAEALAKADILEKRLAELESKASPQVSVPGEPKLEQFDYDPEKYATAKAEFAKTQVSKEIEAKQRTEFQTQAQQRLASAWEEKAAKGEDKYDDWEEKVGTLKPTAPFVAALMEADNGEDIAHYLGTHVKEAQRIAALHPLSQVREIGKLEAKLLSKTVEPKVPSKAPAPITPLTGAAAANSSEPSESDDTGAWIKKRQKQVHGRR
jgi:hypothetical protein